MNASRYDGLQSHCRDCKRSFQSDWYQKNKARHIANAGQTRDLKVLALRARLREYLTEHPCVDCGEAEPLMLDFDHVRGEKFREVSRMVASCFGWERILTEIAKCDVRCVKCHRRRTAHQRGWYGG